jgi:hypothetical protein
MHPLLKTVLFSYLLGTSDAFASDAHTTKNKHVVTDRCFAFDPKIHTNHHVVFRNDSLLMHWQAIETYGDTVDYQLALTRNFFGSAMPGQRIEVSGDRIQHHSLKADKSKPKRQVVNDTMRYQGVIFIPSEDITSADHGRSVIFNDFRSAENLPIHFLETYQTTKIFNGAGKMITSSSSQTENNPEQMQEFSTMVNETTRNAFPVLLHSLFSGVSHP